MLRGLKIILISLLLEMIWISQALAAQVTHTVILEGVIRNIKNYNTYYNFHNGKKAMDVFPLKHYEYELLAYDLHYVGDEHFKNPRISNLNDYAAEITASLDLISRDKKTGKCKFKLSFKSLGLKYISYKDLSMLIEVGGVSVKGKAQLMNIPPSYFEIEVIPAHDKYKNRILINSPNKLFRLRFFVSKDPMLVLLFNLPVKLIYKEQLTNNTIY